MKKLSVFFVLLFLLTGCAGSISEEEIVEPVSDSTSREGILGTWRSENSSATTVFAINKDQTIKIYEHGKGLFGIEDTVSIEGTYTIDQDKLFVTVDKTNQEDVFPEEMVFAYTLNGSQLVVTAQNGNTLHLARQ